ncbi:hypothetical protein GWK41_08590 [Persephonella atlantica]|uniref:PTS EIIA type-2 domain-containing protein n=1 Tax=Persephonella atlantica TaxID=2699429 RepID=A0ABS1GJX4_9AQUI|nr:hypothetical protein [Persephonella atlantica]MBK3333126.1 hypothetical protein [Persephonella atlantica]
MHLESLLRDKIYIEENTHNIYKKLKEELKLFHTMKDLFLVAAAIGFYNQKREPLEKKKDIFTKNIFDKEKDIPFIYILALADRNDKEAVIIDVLSIVEEYANAGIKILADIVKNSTNKREAIDEFTAFLIEKFG